MGDAAETLARRFEVMRPHLSAFPRRVWLGAVGAPPGPGGGAVVGRGGRACTLPFFYTYAAVPASTHRGVCGERKPPEALVGGPDRGVKGGAPTRGGRGGGGVTVPRRKPLSPPAMPKVPTSISADPAAEP